jgi:hypothetical protein
MKNNEKINHYEPKFLKCFQYLKLFSESEKDNYKECDKQFYPNPEYFLIYYGELAFCEKCK